MDKRRSMTEIAKANPGVNLEQAEEVRAAIAIRRMAGLRARTYQLLPGFRLPNVEAPARKRHFQND